MKSSPLGKWWVLGGLAALSVGCSSSASSLCSRATECEWIRAENQQECATDIEDALKDGELANRDVNGCLECVSRNECSFLDVVVDCGADCENVAPFVFGSAIR